MHDSTTALPSRSRIPARSVALPVEHGAWGFLLEPLLAGVMIAPSLAAPFISIFVIGTFLARQPLKFALNDYVQGRNLPRTRLAAKFLLIFAAAGLIGFFGFLYFAPLSALTPFAVAVPVVAYLILQDTKRQTRELLPELLACAALSTSISVLALAAGMTTVFSAALWAVMIARLVPSVLYVRNRLRREKGKSYSSTATMVAHLVAVGLLISLTYFGLSSILTVAFAAFLLARAVSGLAPERKKLTARQLGIREVIYGGIYALTVVIGYYAGV